MLCKQDKEIPVGGADHHARRWDKKQIPNTSMSDESERPFVTRSTWDAFLLGNATWLSLHETLHVYDVFDLESIFVTPTPFIYTAPSEVRGHSIRS